MKKLISHSATILPCANLEESISFYREKLGFRLTFTWEDPVSYAVLKLGDSISIHLVSKDPNHITCTLHTSVCIFSHDIDALYLEYKNRDVPISNPLALQEYGMKEFDITDPDGHILAFGQEVSSASE
jgi:catechol 2,3-dioxygenase-like lactoylglutathione lyase family enzyme